MTTLLRHASVADTTHRRYRTAVLGFIHWARSSYREITHLDEFDTHVSDYIQHLFNSSGRSGSGKTTANYVVYGLMHLQPGLRSRLPIAQRSLKGWNRLFPAKPYPPMTWEVAVSVALLLARRFSSLRWGLAVLLSFDCLLRVGELLGLDKEDVAFSQDPRLNADSSCAMLRLRHTKTGPNKWVRVENLAVIALLRTVVQASADGQLLFSFPVADYRTAFKSAVTALGLSPSYVPHSLRHGQATRLFMLGVPLPDIMLRGRWAASSSATRYIQAGPALLLAQRVPADVARMGSLSDAALLAAFSLLAPQVV